VKRVKELGKLVLGKMLDNEMRNNKKLKAYLKSKNIGWIVPNLKSVEKMFFSPHEMSTYRVHKYDLLLSEGGGIGKTVIWNEELEECYIQNSVHKFTANKENDPFYLLYFSFSAGHSGYYDSIVNQVSIKHLTKEKLSRVIWLSPSLDEQKAISNYLNTKTAQIDRIVENINLQIEKLKELRKTLINDVVTGKIKVAKDITGEEDCCERTTSAG
jgi:type I restriction enzyme S subunit